MPKKLREITETLNEVLKPYYALIIMIIFFFTLFITSYNIVFKHADLSVKIEKQNINYPNSINDEYIKIYNLIIKQKVSEDIRVANITVYDYLLRTKHNWIITLKNESSKTIKKVNLRIINVAERTAWAISSDFLLEEEKAEVLQKVKFEKKSALIFLKDFVNIPPQKSISIYLWGKFDESFWHDNVVASFDGGEGVIIKTIEVSGFKAYIFEYLYELVIIILFVFVIVYYYSQKQEKGNAVYNKENIK